MGFKPLGYDFRMEYKCGAQKSIADSFSQLNTLSQLMPQWCTKLREAYKREPSYHDQMIVYQNRHCISPTTPCKMVILEAMHCILQGGHSGNHNTLHRVATDFYWSYQWEDVQQSVKGCDVYNEWGQTTVELQVYYNPCLFLKKFGLIL